MPEDAKRIYNRLAAKNDSMADQMWMGLEEHIAHIDRLAVELKYGKLNELDLRILRWSALAVSAVIHRKRADREMLGLEPLDD